ncbi:hypothetical protein ABEF91_000287 [Exophiala dermatitidis]
MDRHTLGKITIPGRAARKSQRLSSVDVYPSSQYHQIGTLKFDELNFENTLPLPEKSNDLSREPSLTSLTATTPSRRLTGIGLHWTTAIVGLPIFCFTVVLIVLVFVYRVSTDSTHPFAASPSHKADHRYILVDFSSTRLVFVASWSSTLAPMLLGSLMALWHIPTVCKMAAHTTEDNIKELPTPYQLSMLIGLSSGSFDELRKYVMYLFSNVKASQPRILSRSALIMVVSSLLAALVFGADTAIHAFTSTTSVSMVYENAQAQLSSGRGLISECIGFNRTANQGLPCTVVADSSLGANTLARDTAEIISLEQNVSLRNSIWTIKADELTHGDLVILMPQTKGTPPNVDYHATTVGVSTQCVPSTSKCDMRLSDQTDADTSFVMFNCTDNFRGVLGAPPSISNNTVLWTQTDSTTPNFNVKLDRNFQYAYFSDPEFIKIYNSIGGNLTNNGSSGDLALPDDSLLNPIYLATAGLIPVLNGPAGESLNRDEDVLSVGGSMVAYSLNCTVTSFDVAYDWVYGAISSFNYTLTPNGSIIELSHGMQAVGMPSLSQGQSLASLSKSAAGLARSFANAHSTDSLTLIGSVMSPRTNLAEATRRDVLVAKVNTAVFGFLVGSNLLFVVFGLVLLIRAWRVHSPSTLDMVARMSVEGLSAMAFEDTVEKRVRRVADVQDMFEESRIGDSSRKVGLKAYPGGGHVMFVEQPRL